MSEQTAAATWARQVPMYRKMMKRLREVDVQCVEPPDFETPPHKRGLPLPEEPSYSTGTGGVPAGKDGGRPLTNDRTSEEQ